MTAFSQFLGQFLKFLWKDIVAFFQSIFIWFVELWKSIISKFSLYNSIFDNHSPGFNGLGWALFALSIILFIAFIVLIAFIATKAYKRRHIAKRKVKDKIVLLKEIDKLNNKVIDLMDQRSQLLAHIVVFKN